MLAKYVMKKIASAALDPGERSDESDDRAVFEGGGAGSGGQDPSKMLQRRKGKMVKGVCR